jgi:phage/plasmid-like protein (TIGR03299 family)
MIDGKPAMMFVDQPPWHKLGQKLDSPPTTAEAIKAAQFDWEVVKKPVYVADHDHFYALPGYQATVRADLWGKPECKSFGLVGKHYQVLQNTAAFSFFDPVIKSGKVTYETAGALGDGERVWVLAKVKGDISVRKVDDIQRYLLLSNGHDGRTALQIRFTPVRVVCQNTLTWALQGGGDLIKTHHGQGLHRRVEDAQEAVKGILGHYDQLTQHFERFAGFTLLSDKLANYVNLVFPAPKRKSNQTDRGFEETLARNNELRDTSARLAVEGRGNQLPATEGTLWAACNGITELVDHYPSYHDSPWHRLESVCLGEGHRTKRRAFDVALDILRN